MTLTLKGTKLTAVLAGFGPIVFTKIQSAIVPKTPFRTSVPTPAEVARDPVAVAETIAIAAGIVIFVPFPGILFNRTLEENYDEIVARVRRTRQRLGGLFAMLWLLMVQHQSTDL